MVVKIRGIDFQENNNNEMGLEFVNLSHRFGYQCPNWPYFRDVQIERMHYMAKSGVLSQTLTTTMHVTTHIDAPAHVVLHALLALYAPPPNPTFDPSSNGLRFITTTSHPADNLDGSINLNRHDYPS